MAAQSSASAVVAAWGALAGLREGATQGWRTVPIEAVGSCRVLAGRHFPDDAEALLVGFHSIVPPAARLLPSGRGFDVTALHLEAGGVDYAWLALARRQTADPEMFLTMVRDLLEVLEGLAGASSPECLASFVARISAWQEFMRRDGSGILSPDAEVGLVGELLMLGLLLDAGTPPATALEWWRGPLSGLQDFVIGTGAIEVKSTVAAAGFPADIGALEQLDDSHASPLFLAAVRLSASDAGSTLPEHAVRLRPRMTAAGALATFNTLLLRAGLIDDYADKYTRRFSPVRTRLMRVDASFPRLVRANVPTAVVRARYELELDRVDAPSVELPAALAALGGA